MRFTCFCYLGVCAIPFALAQPERGLPGKARLSQRSSTRSPRIQIRTSDSGESGFARCSAEKRRGHENAQSAGNGESGTARSYLSDPPNRPLSPAQESKNQYFLQLPAVTCGAGNIRVEATNSGNNADYATLKEAFDAINAGTHTGVINIGVCGDTTETASAVLNASGVGAANYTLVLITPTGVRTVSGAIVAGSPLIDLNGADNVTIDGLNSGGNSLTISNTTVSATAGTSTIRLINGAQNNTITRCTVLGSSTASTCHCGRQHSDQHLNGRSKQQ